MEDPFIVITPSSKWCDSIIQNMKKSLFRLFAVLAIWHNHKSGRPSKSLWVNLAWSYKEAQPCPVWFTPTLNPTCLFEFQISAPSLIQNYLFLYNIFLIIASLIRACVITFISSCWLTSLDLFIIHILSSPILFQHEVFKPGHHLCKHLIFVRNYTYIQRFVTSLQPNQTKK